MTILRRLIAWAAGFLEEHTSSSSARLAGLSLCWTGCYVALAAVHFAFLHPDRLGSLTAFAAIITALLGSGFGVLWTRSRTGADALPPGGPA